jgi:hypothetical protein
MVVKWSLKNYKQKANKVKYARGRRFESNQDKQKVHESSKLRKEGTEYTKLLKRKKEEMQVK